MDIKNSNDKKPLTVLDRFSKIFLSEKSREVSERYIVAIAIAGFVIHLVLIGLSHWGILPEHELLSSTLVAVYTPFSIILIYEVYLLVYYLPKSISKYIGKQYEIITLIVIRKIFNDISKIEFTPDWFHIKGDLQFTYDIIATLILFFLISVFYKLMNKRETSSMGLNENTTRFISTKKWVSITLIPLLLSLAVYNLINWTSGFFNQNASDIHSLKELNNIFFEDFFTLLILADVFLLLVSFLYTQTFQHVMRNSGFVISTVLIKMSFGQEGIIGSILTVAAVIIGVAFMYIYLQYEKINQKENEAHTPAP